MALSAIGKRLQKQSLPTQKRFPEANSAPLFDIDEHEDSFPLSTHMLQSSSEDDEELAFAVQDSIDQMRSTKVSHAIGVDSPGPPSIAPVDWSNDVDNPAYSPSSKGLYDPVDPFASPTRLETALSIAGAGPSRAYQHRSPSKSALSAFGRPILLSSSPQPSITASLSEGEQDGAVSTRDNLEHVDAIPDSNEELNSLHLSSVVKTPSATFDAGTYAQASDSDMDMEEVIPEHGVSALRSQKELENMPSSMIQDPSPPPFIDDQLSAAPSLAPVSRSIEEREENDLSRSPSPFRQPSDDRVLGSTSPVHDPWDAAQEMDPQAEEGEFARFMSQVKGKDIDDVRREIDDEIKSLNQQKKAAMRDSEDITQQMISQIMVRWIQLTTFSPSHCSLCRPCYVFLESHTLQHQWRRKRNALNWSPSD
jgi:DNA excision repair protein ERCC-5